MTLDIVRGTNGKPVATDELVQSLAGNSDLDGQLIVGFPLLASGADQQSIDAIFISPTLGAVIFDLVEGPVDDEYRDRQDELARLFQTRLLPHKALYSRRTLAIDLTVITFTPALSEFGEEDYPIASPDTIAAVLQELYTDYDNSIRYDTLLSAIQNISRLRAAKHSRPTQDENSLGARLKRLESSIATLDHKQSKAVIETIDGVQRIRGLAGSGKTIILALKAAYLHAQHPEWRIAVTYNTRSLHEQFRRLISQFCIEQSGEEPDWAKLNVLNAWGSIGGRGPTGIYAEFCHTNNVVYHDFRSASNNFRRSKAFASACEEALNAVTQPTPTYDAILVDEAQDFPPEFLRLAYMLLRDPKRLVYAYDELQSLDGSGLPSPEEIFGRDETGRALVALNQNSYDLGASRDIVLPRCYRNSRPVLSVAHAIGFGIYRDKPEKATTQLVQMFGQPGLWEEIGYEVLSGSLQPNSEVELSRTNESSPRFLEDHSTTDELIQFLRFDSKPDQDQWVAEQIERNLDTDELLHDDIVVVNPNGITARSNLSPLRSLLLRAGVKSHLAGVDTDADVFFDRGSRSVTFTGIHRAKGNEAGMVYIVNAQEGIDTTINLAQNRNRLFTAITRSKAWVRVLGVGREMDQLIAEYTRTRDADFHLRFVYPSEQEREKLRIVHREVTAKEQRDIEKTREGISSIVSKLNSGAVALEDLDPQAVAALTQILGSHDD
ncbi:DEAD/DEAH box helicase [Promicromonospora soli]